MAPFVPTPSGKNLLFCRRGGRTLSCPNYLFHDALWFLQNIPALCAGCLMADRCTQHKDLSWRLSAQLRQCKVNCLETELSHYSLFSQELHSECYSQRNPSHGNCNLIAAELCWCNWAYFSLLLFFALECHRAMYEQKTNWRRCLTSCWAPGKKKASIKGTPWQDLSRPPARWTPFRFPYSVFHFNPWCCLSSELQQHQHKVQYRSHYKMHRPHSSSTWSAWKLVPKWAEDY